MATVRSTRPTCSRCSSRCRAAGETSPSGGRPHCTGTLALARRVGNRVALRWLAWRSGLQAHDIAPARVCRRDDLERLGVADHRFGYPVELLLRAGRGWLDRDRGRRRLPPAGRRHAVEGLGVRRRSLRAALDFARVLS